MGLLGELHPTEQVGAVGLIAYQLLLGSIVFAGLIVAARSRTAERVLMAGGVAILVLVQWAVIQCGTLGQLPLTGIVVPFVSAGRSSIVMFLALVGMVTRLATDDRARAPSAELDEMQAGVRGLGLFAVVIGATLVACGIRAAVMNRHEVSARGIVTRLADGVLTYRQNPRLTAIAARIRRGTITDRNGVALAISATSGQRTYPLGVALGTLLGVHPTRVLLPPWALERVFDHRLRGHGERDDGPYYRDFDPRGPDVRMSSPDLRGFADLLDLDGGARDERIRAIDAELAARSVQLTIDAQLQAKVAALLVAVASKHVAAAAVVIDVDTGQILARVQVPDYDPSKPVWQDRILANDVEYLRRFRGTYGAWPDKTGVQGMFQAGSVGKLFTAIAAVRAGSAGARYSCTERDAQGPLFKLPTWSKPIHDHANDSPHGTIDLVDALAVSCNVYFAQLGLALGPDPLVSLHSAGVDVGFTSTFDPGSNGSRQLATTAFGQGAMAMNTVEAARLVAAIAAGGKYRKCAPTMELGVPCVETSLVDDSAKLAPIIVGMRRAMTGGTGMRLTVPAGLRAYGKTGTADVQGFAGEEPFGIARGSEASPHSYLTLTSKTGSRHTFSIAHQWLGELEPEESCY